MLRRLCEIAVEGSGFVVPSDTDVSLIVSTLHNTLLYVCIIFTVLLVMLGFLYLHVSRVKQ